MNERPKHSDGRFLKLPFRALIWLGIVRTSKRRPIAPFDALIPIGYVFICNVPDHASAYVALEKFAWLARMCSWLDEHKWDLDERCFKHGLMWLEEGDYYANAKWRFPWRRLPSIPAVMRRMEQRQPMPSAWMKHLPSFMSEA